MLDVRGRTCGYQQILYGFPHGQYARDSIGGKANEENILPDFSTSELIYRPRWTRSFTPYGFPPSEWVILRVNTALRKQSFDLRYFTDGNIPDVWIQPVDDKQNLSPAQVSAFEEAFNALLEGNDAARRKAKFLPWRSDVKEMRPFSYDTKLDEWMMKITCAAYGVTPSELGFTSDVNRATADSQENITYRRGLKPLAIWLKTLFDQIIQEDLGFPDLEWHWSFGESEDLLTQATTDSTYINTGVLSADEVRSMRFGGLVEGPSPATLAAQEAEEDAEEDAEGDDFEDDGGELDDELDDEEIGDDDEEETTAKLSKAILAGDLDEIDDIIEKSIHGAVAHAAGRVAGKAFSSLYGSALRAGKGKGKTTGGGKSKGGVKNPGSRGGHVWYDKSGKPHYGPKPAASPHHAGAKAKPHSSSTGASKPAGRATKPKDYRTTKTPRSTLSHINRILEHGGLPGGPKLSNHEENILPDFSTSELIYRPRWTRSFTPYGFPPSEWVILRVNTALRKQSFDLRYFTDGNIPDVWIQPVDDKQNLSPAQVSAFEEAFNALLEGNDAARRKAKFLPWRSDVKEMRPFSYDTKLDEWMMKITCAAYGVTPSELGFTSDVNRATADSQENITYRRGLKPLAIWLKTLFDQIIQEDLGFPDLEWHWSFGESEDLLTQATTDSTYINTGVLSADEVRSMRFGGLVEGPSPATLAAQEAEEDAEEDAEGDDFEDDGGELDDELDDEEIGDDDEEETTAKLSKAILAGDLDEIDDIIEKSIHGAVAHAAGRVAGKAFSSLYGSALRAGKGKGKTTGGGKSKGGVKNPGSRGGHVWYDKSGKPHYGPKPAASPHHAGAKAKPHSSSTGASKPAGRATKPKDYRTTKTPRSTLSHINRILEHGGLPGGPKLSNHELNQLRSHASTLKTKIKQDSKAKREAAKQTETKKIATLETIESAFQDIFKLLG